MHSSDDDFVMETDGNDSSSSDFEKAISRKKPKKVIENPEHLSSEYIKHKNMENTLEKLVVNCVQRPSNTRKVLQGTSTRNTWR